MVLLCSLSDRQRVTYTNKDFVCLCANNNAINTKWNEMQKSKKTTTLFSLCYYIVNPYSFDIAKYI